jgi:hypothetical protein
MVSAFMTADDKNVKIAWSPRCEMAAANAGASSSARAFASPVALTSATPGKENQPSDLLPFL